MTWQNLGPRADDTSSRAWLSIPVHPLDGTRWLYSGTTNWEDDVMRWDAPTERWRMALRGPGALAGPTGPYFPQAHAVAPVATDNGFAVWDGDDQLWVNTVNPYNYASALYTRATNSWRAVTLAEFPSYPADFASLFNAGTASNADTIAIYGGSLTGDVSHLWIYRRQTRLWRKYANHGTGTGKPGPIGNIENQFRWAAPLNRFLLYHTSKVWTLTPDTLIWEPWVTTGTPPTRIRGVGLELIGDYALVFGQGPRAWALHMPTRAWQEVASPGTTPARSNAAFWSAAGHLYQTWGTGTEAGTGADVWRFPNVLAALSTRPTVGAITAA